MSDPRSVHVTADVLYASDLHGQRGLYLDFFEMAWRTRARAAILGGDLAPHMDVTAQRKFYSEFFLPLVREYLGKSGSADLYYIAGNDDWKASLTVVEEAGIDRLRYIHGRSIEFLDGTWIAGLASVPITPFGMKDWDRWEEGLSPAARMEGFRSEPEGGLRAFTFKGRERQESLAADLEAVERTLPPEGTPLICVFHSPPYGTALDQIARGVHVGSRETRRFLERRRPLLGLHGHIHESPAVSGRFADRVGPTICVNAGQKMGSALHAAWFRLDDLEGTLEHSLLGKATSAK
ncbi:MAG TPA: metallophosphoesterase [Candidatus Dormibacteraeota bacterium]|nr:metallophosphoesterase [Candidatus Dormibacteraeota bacterium]